MLSVEEEGTDTGNNDVTQANPQEYVEPTTDNMASMMDPRPGRFLMS